MAEAESRTIEEHVTETMLRLPFFSFAGFIHSTFIFVALSLDRVLSKLLQVELLSHYRFALFRA